MAGELGLSDHHQNAIVSFLRFARYQRNQKLRVIECCFEDLKSSRLLEVTYTNDEVWELLDDLLTIVKGEVETELINSAHMNVLLLRQLCSQAEKWHLSLEADVSELENRELLEKIRNFEDQELAIGPSNKKDQFSPKKSNKLEPLSEVQGPAKLLQTEIDRLSGENEKLNLRVKNLESKAYEILEEKSKLQENLLETQSQLKETRKQKVDEGNQDLKALEEQVSKVKMEMEENLKQKEENQQSLENDLSTTKYRLLEVQAQLELAEKELEKKFSQTAAYVNMKQILRSKNDQIKDLRKKLSEIGFHTTLIIIQIMMEL
ncbi:leucine zipper transcription factor-like protein 1 isoform X1 [Tachypleus tridentatus]|uniref:leucine zipper transcription factor-like protein 1 isoform X1 n=1 Tax=Tachypleus tridentatus TaxID=6853 RepID=UPI003FD672C8